MSQLDILLLILRVAFAAFVPLCFIAVCVWMERRGCAYFQDRSGPNRANIFGFRAGGLVQNLADAVKLITKEDVIPGHIKHKFYFVLAPVIVFRHCFSFLCRGSFCRCTRHQRQTVSHAGHPDGSRHPLVSWLWLDSASTALSLPVGPRTINTVYWWLASRSPGHQL